MHPEHRSIGELAYLLWQARGCPPGTAEKDWLDAEKQLSESLGGRVSEQPAAKSSAKRPSRPRVLKPKSASSKPVSSDSSKPGDAAG